MGSASRYWQLVRLDNTGQRKVEEIAIAKTFFHQRFSVWITQANVADQMIQQELFQRLRTEQSIQESEREAAEWCLRCCISHYIEQACVQLDVKFGSQHGFTRHDLLPLVLDDDGQATVQLGAAYRSLASKILQTFDPDRARLSTWVMRQVRHHQELKRFLQERGIALVTDWALLKDTSLEQLQHILSEFYGIVPTEIRQAAQLLQAYQQIYCGDRLHQRQQGYLKGKEECLPPTPEQLTRMAQLLPSQTGLLPTNASILNRLQALATQLRRYRLHVYGKWLPTASLDHPKTYAIAAAIQAPELDPEHDTQQEFLAFYRQQLLYSLDEAIAQVIDDRLTVLQRKKPQMVDAFLTALWLFHSQGQSMGEIAPKIGLQAQFQVTRLVKLKELRASVQAKVLQALLEQVLEKAKTYRDPSTLQQLNHEIALALDEEIAGFMQQAEAEAIVMKHQPLKSLFAQRLCAYLDTRKTTP